MQSYQEAVKWAAKYLDMDIVSLEELREEAQAKKDGSYTPKSHGENEMLNNVFYDLPPDAIPGVDQFINDVQGLGSAVKASNAFWDAKSEEMRQRYARGESPFTVEILQALGLQNKGNRLYTLLCTPGNNLRNSQEFYDLTDDYLGPFHARAIVDIYESGCLAAIHNESPDGDGSGVGGLDDLAKAIAAAGDDSEPLFGP